MMMMIIIDAPLPLHSEETVPDGNEIPAAQPSPVRHFKEKYVHSRVEQHEILGPYEFTDSF
jgi:hypothetical protein